MTQVEIENTLREKKTELKIWRGNAIAETLAKRDKTIKDAVLPLESTIQQMKEVIADGKDRMGKMRQTLHFLWVADNKGTMSDEMRKDYEEMLADYAELKKSIRSSKIQLEMMQTEVSTLIKEIKCECRIQLNMINEKHEREYCKAKQEFCKALKELWDGEKDGDKNSVADVQPYDK